jgi:hypothetical protein
MAKLDLNKIAQTSSDVEDLKKRQKISELVSMGIIVVFFIAFIGVVFALGISMTDSYRSSESSYSDLVNKVNDQNYRISELNKTLNLVCKTWRKDCPIQ